MTIALTGPSGFYTRLGRLGAVLADVNTFQDVTIPGAIANIVGNYTTSEYMIDGIAAQQTSNQSANMGLAGYLAQVAAYTLNQTVYLDNPQSSNTNITISMTELIRQMNVSGDTVKKCTVGISPAATGGNSGNGVCVGTVLNTAGVPSENVFTETFAVTCTRDSSSAGVNAGSESFQIATAVASNNPLDWTFPLGSGAQTSLTAINTSLLTNGGFETWSGSTPSSWTLLVGTAGVDILKSVAEHYADASSLQILGGGANVSLAQSLTLSQQVLYAFNGFAKVDVIPASGVLTVDLVDGSNTVVNNQAGTANSFTLSCTALTNAWTAFNGVFVTPHIMPATMKLRFRLSTALSNGTNLFVDNFALSRMNTLYAQGPSLAVFAGSSPFYQPDSFTVTVTNNRAGSTNGKTFQTLTDRLFGMRSLGLQLPSSSSPTISDALIV